MAKLTTQPRCTKTELNLVGFDYNSEYDEYFKMNKGNNAKVYLYYYNNQVAKFYWQKIIFIYDNENKPILKIETQHNANIRIFSDKFEIWFRDNQHSDSQFIIMPIFFDVIRFGGELNWGIPVLKLQKRGE